MLAHSFKREQSRTQYGYPLLEYKHSLHCPVFGSHLKNVFLASLIPHLSLLSKFGGISSPNTLLQTLVGCWMTWFGFSVLENTTHRIQTRLLMPGVKKNTQAGEWVS